MDLAYAGLLAAALALHAAAAASRRLAPPALAALALLAAYHMYCFFAGRFQLALVYLNSAAGYGPLEKAAGALANIPGAVYFTALPLSAAAAARGGRAAPLAVAALLAYAALEQPWAEVPGAPETGIGLNPLLRSLWAVPHPLAVLASYGLLLAAAAYNSRRMLLAGWTANSLGLLLGAIWSFQTFGWNGYWAWDPVENALLAVWLAATAALHHGGRALKVLAAAAVLAGLAVNQGGFSALHSFTGSGYTPHALLASSLALAAASLAMLARERGPLDQLRLAAYGMAAVALYMYGVVAFPAAASLAGLPAAPPQGDQFVLHYMPPLAAAAFGALFYMSAYGGSPRRAAAVFLAVLAPAVAVPLAAHMGALPMPAPRSLLSTNFFLLALALGGLAAAAMSRHVPHRPIHAAFALLLAAVAVSGPFAYNMSYSAVLLAEPGVSYFTLQGWPQPAGVSIREVQYVADGARVLLDGPLRELWLAAPNYTAFVRSVGGPLSLAGLNYSVVDLAGVKYVVVWSGGRQLGSYGGVPVMEVSRNGTTVVFPAPLDLVEALSRRPDLVARYLACLPNSSLTVPNGLKAVLRLRLEWPATPWGPALSYGTELEVRYEAAAAVRGMRLALGTAEVYGPPGAATVVAAPPAAGLAWDALTARYVKALLDSCNSRAAFAAYAAVSRNSTLAGLVEYLSTDSDTWALMLRTVPAAWAVWALGSVLVALSVRRLWA